MDTPANNDWAKERQREFAAQRTPWVREVIRLNADLRDLSDAAESLVRAVESGSAVHQMEAVSQVKRAILRARA